MNQPLPGETVNWQQMEIDRLCGVTDQGIYRRIHTSHLHPWVDQWDCLACQTSSLYNRGWENRYNEYEHQRYSYIYRQYSFNRHTEHPGRRRYNTTPNQDRYNNTNNSLVIEALEKISNNFDLINRQPLVTAALNAVKEFDGTNKSSTILWLDQVELVSKRSSINPVDIGISKLVGIPLRNMTTIKHEEGNLIWYRFWQVLTENYSDIWVVFCVGSQLGLVHCWQWVFVSVSSELVE